jgi:hypothetical protein
MDGITKTYRGMKTKREIIDECFIPLDKSQIKESIYIAVEEAMEVYLDEALTNWKKTKLIKVDDYSFENKVNNYGMYLK